MNLFTRIKRSGNEAERKKEENVPQENGGPPSLFFRNKTNRGGRDEKCKCSDLMAKSKVSKASADEKKQTPKLRAPT
jgi:hypothetical protein